MKSLLGQQHQVHCGAGGSWFECRGNPHFWTQGKGGVQKGKGAKGVRVKQQLVSDISSCNLCCYREKKPKY